MTKNKKIKIDVPGDDRMENEISGHVPDDAPESDIIDPDEVVEDMDERLETSEQELKDTYDRLLRLTAEFENYKKRSTRELDGFKKYANEALVNALLPVVDNLERAVEASKEGVCDNDSLLEGVCLTLTEILKVLERFHVKPIVSLGEIFDPNFHQAMMQEPSEEHPENTILKEMQKGYLIHNRLLRPAMVVVSKKK
jgi:molecular chaperone GrpE